MPFQLERHVLFRLGPAADYVREQSQFKNTEAKAVQRVCSFVGTKGLVELEKLSTVAWIRSTILNWWPFYRTPCRPIYQEIRHSGRLRALFPAETVLSVHGDHGAVAVWGVSVAGGSSLRLDCSSSMMEPTTSRQSAMLNVAQSSGPN